MDFLRDWFPYLHASRSSIKMRVASKDVVVYCFNSAFYLSMDGVRKSYPDTDSILRATASLPRPGAAVLITRSQNSGSLEVTDLLEPQKPALAQETTSKTSSSPQEVKETTLKSVEHWLESIPSPDNMSVPSV